MMRMPRSRSRSLAVALAVPVAAAFPAGAVAAPVAHALYHMNEAPGATKMIDSSGFGNNAALTPFGIALGVSGFSGTAYSFNGTGGRASVTSATLNPGRANVTLAVRFSSTTRPSAAVGDYDVIRKGLSGNPGGY